MQPCNRIYYSNVYWILNMFRAAHRSSSGAPNWICSLWFIYTCGDQPLSKLSGKWIFFHSAYWVKNAWYTSPFLPYTVRRLVPQHTYLLQQHSNTASHTFTQKGLLLLWQGDFLWTDRCHNEKNPASTVNSRKGTFQQYALTLRRLMSYIYGAPILDVSRSHTTTQHSR